MSPTDTKHFGHSIYNKSPLKPKSPVLSMGSGAAHYNESPDEMRTKLH